MTRKKLISGLIVFVLMSTVLASFTLGTTYDAVVYTYTNGCCNTGYPSGNSPWLNLSDVPGLGPDWRIDSSNWKIQNPTNGGIYVAGGDYNSSYNSGYARFYYVMTSGKCCRADEFVIKVRLRTGESTYEYKYIKYFVTCPPENLTLECCETKELDLYGRYTDFPCLSGYEYKFDQMIVGPTYGSAVPIDDNKGIRYTAPCCGGADYFIFKVKEKYWNGWCWDWRYKLIRINVATNCEGPTANDDFYTTTENTCVDLPVTSNDVPGDLPIKVSWVSDPANGTVTIKDDNTITYCPTANYCGEDTFIYQISDGGCGTDTATVTVTIPCKTPIPETVLYPNLGLERLSIPATGTDVISNGQIVSALEVIPGTQILSVEVENRGMVTQAEVKITLQGLPQGVTYTLEPELQKITAHNIGTFTLTITASADVPPGTYPVTITASSLRGSLDQKVINVVIQ